MLLAEDESEKEKEGRELMEETADCNDLEGVELSMNSVVGLTSPKTMKVRGTVKGQDVVVLIDSGATDNFMSWELIKELKPPVTETDGYKVQVGTGRAVNGIGKCRGVVLQLQSLVVVQDYLPIEMGSSDIILGIQWLTTLGTVQKLIGKH